eukprot:TRINITY_DN10936_c0_g1_i1.p1 TRINITY_DN10936_c0_g1~~TRINITY_DN10936_c0_g1_i1.p1  ORF type:complete len:589 (-),score=74.14 TRINITY_DN10936_c0_g1_i1:14-1666(-)
MPQQTSSTAKQPPAASFSLYTVMGLTQTATEDEIRRAYKKLAMRYHPDKGGEEKKFKELCTAYEILSDSRKKEIYDRYGDPGIPLAQQAGNTGAPRTPTKPASRRASMGDTRPPRSSDQEPQQPPPGQPFFMAPPRVVFLEATLESLYKGTSCKLPVKRLQPCSQCQGRGLARNATEHTCEKCRGSGLMRLIMQQGYDVFEQIIPCDRCDGAGKFIKSSDLCESCHGEKLEEVPTQLKVTVPRGAQHNEELVYAGEGDQIPGLLPGDVVVVLKQLSHSRFMREGDHLHMEVQVTLADALRGGGFVVTHLDGRLLRISPVVIEADPAGSQGPSVRPLVTGDIRVVPNEGMPISGTNERGSFVLHIVVSMPPTLLVEQADAIYKILTGSAFQRPESPAPQAAASAGSAGAAAAGSGSRRNSANIPPIPEGRRSVPGRQPTPTPPPWPMPTKASEKPETTASPTPAPTAPLSHNLEGHYPEPSRTSDLRPSSAANPQQTGLSANSPQPLTTASSPKRSPVKISDAGPEIPMPMHDSPTKQTPFPDSPASSSLQ